MDLKAGDRVKWRMGLDEDFCYGIILEVHLDRALVEYIGFHEGLKVDLPKKRLKNIGGGTFGGSKSKNCK